MGFGEWTHFNTMNCKLVGKGVTQLIYLKLLVVAALLPLFSGCVGRVKPDIYHCYDEQGRPLEGVLFICNYIGSTLMSYRSAGADYRFSDANGVLYFGDNEVTKQLPGFEMRTITYVYSTRLHSGDYADGEYVSPMVFGPGDPLPLYPATEGKYAVYRFNDNRMEFQDCRNDPVRWHFSLFGLIKHASMVVKRDGHYTLAGIEQLEAMLVPFVEKERAMFLEKYGNAPVPLAYRERMLREFPETPPEKRASLTFNDITLSIESRHHGVPFNAK